MGAKAHSPTPPMISGSAIAKLSIPIVKELVKKVHRQLNPTELEKAFVRLKPWRGIAMRYAKNFSSFLAAVQIRCIALRAEIL